MKLLRPCSFQLSLFCFFLSLSTPVVMGSEMNADGAGKAAHEEEGKGRDSGGEHLSQFWQDNSKGYNLAVEIGAKYKKEGESELELHSGSFLVESKDTVILRLPMSTWKLKPKSMLLVRVAPEAERLYCLLDQASATCEGKNIPLRLGEEVLISTHIPKPEEVAGEFDVGVRLPRAFDLSENRKVSSMEFSIVQAMEREPLLSQISHSKHAHDKALKLRLLKAAAVLNYVTSRHGPYVGY
jgi:hypothetical protein